MRRLLGSRGVPTLGGGGPVIDPCTRRPVPTCRLRSSGLATAGDVRHTSTSKPSGGVTLTQVLSITSGRSAGRTLTKSISPRDVDQRTRAICSTAATNASSVIPGPPLICAVHARRTARSLRTECLPIHPRALEMTRSEPIPALAERVVGVLGRRPRPLRRQWRVPPRPRLQRLRDGLSTAIADRDLAASLSVMQPEPGVDTGGASLGERVGLSWQGRLYPPPARGGQVEFVSVNGGALGTTSAVVGAAAVSPAGLGFGSRGPRRGRRPASTARRRRRSGRRGGGPVGPRRCAAVRHSGERDVDRVPAQRGRGAARRRRPA